MPWMEADIEEMYRYCQRFDQGDFFDSDAYEKVYEEFMFYYTCLEEGLNDVNFDIFERMMKAMEDMEMYRDLHYFRQGVLLEREVQKQKAQKRKKS